MTTRDNHFVSQGYLKQWDGGSGQISVYRVLVSHDRVPLWTQKSIKGVGYQQNLYSREINGIENDLIEKWFSTEFESPATEAIRGAICGHRLAPEDWHKLVRFLAMHDVRTPARLLEYLKRNGDSTPEVLKMLFAAFRKNFMLQNGACFRSLHLLSWINFSH